jgi:hypothetical protein
MASSLAEAEDAVAELERRFARSHRILLRTPLWTTNPRFKWPSMITPAWTSSCSWRVERCAQRYYDS